MANMEIANIANNNNNNNNGDNNGEMSQEEREFIEAAQKRARSASNILRSMTNPSDAGKAMSLKKPRIQVAKTKQTNLTNQPITCSNGTSMIHPSDKCVALDPITYCSKCLSNPT